MLSTWSQDWNEKNAKEYKTTFEELELIELEWEGKGAFGNVVKGLDPKTRNYYALKFISLLDVNGNINEKLKEKTMKEIYIL